MTRLNGLNRKEAKPKLLPYFAFNLCERERKRERERKKERERVGVEGSLRERGSVCAYMRKLGIEC